MKKLNVAAAMLLLAFLFVVSGVSQKLAPSPFAVGAGGGGGGSTCSGSSGQILVSNGSSGCTGATPTISGSTITASLTGHASLDLPLTGGTLTGNLLFTDATYDIGATGATRPRDLFLSRNQVIGGTLTVTGAVTGASFSSGGAINACDGTAGCNQLGQGTAPSALPTTAIQEIAPTSVTSYRKIKPGAVSASGIPHYTYSASPVVQITESVSAVVEADITLADNTTDDCSTTKHGFTPKAPNDTTKFLNGACAWTVPAGGGSAFAPGGYPYYGGLFAPITISISSVANRMSYTPVIVPAPGWTITSVKLVNSTGAGDHITACWYDSTGALFTNGQGSTATTGTGSTIATITFTSLTLTSGQYFLGITSHNDTGTTAVYSGITANVSNSGWTEDSANSGLSGSTYLYFLGPTGANLATGTTTLTCPAAVGTRTATGLASSGTNIPFVTFQ